MGRLALWLTVLSIVGVFALTAAALFNYAREYEWQEACRAANPLGVRCPVARGSWLTGAVAWGVPGCVLAGMLYGRVHGRAFIRQREYPANVLLGSLVGNLVLGGIWVQWRFALALPWILERYVDIPVRISDQASGGLAWTAGLTIQFLFITLGLTLLALVCLRLGPDSWRATIFQLGFFEGVIALAFALVHAFLLLQPPPIQ